MPRRKRKTIYEPYSQPEHYHPPIRTAKGIKARSQHGDFARNWWAERWIKAMEELVDPRRLGRGKNYARQGQVLSIDERNGGVEARVQGSVPKPYRVVLKVRWLDNAAWDKVIDVLSSEALYAAQLLAGEMPERIQDAFAAAGTSLFPAVKGDLYTDCSCPDWANPCKHVAATHFILAERFDEDPFLLFRLRGRTQEQIVTAMRLRRGGSAEPVAEEEEEPVVVPSGPEPLDPNPEAFWAMPKPLEDLEVSVKAPLVEMPALRRLGDPIFLEGDSLLKMMTPVYQEVRRQLLSEPPPEENGNGNGNGK